MKCLVSTLAVIGACSTASLAHGQTPSQDLMPPLQRPWALAPLLLDRPDKQPSPGTSGPTTWQDLMPRPQPPAPATMPPARPANQPFPWMHGQTNWQDLTPRPQPPAPAPMPLGRPENQPFPGMHGQTTWQDLMPRRQPAAPAPMPPDRAQNQLFPRMPNEHESWVLSGGAYTTFRASNTMTLDQMVEQMLAHGVPASSARSAAPQLLRALRSVPIRYGAVVVALGAGGWALYQHFFSGDEKPVAQGTLK